MGISWHLAKFLLWAKSENIQFDNTITVGRLNWFTSKGDIDFLCKLYKYEPININELLIPRPKYSEPFLKMLGAQSIDSVDNSEYENATLIHDMNQPIKDELKCKYDLLIDGGTIEHVFNFPVAIANYMNMVKVGGSIIIDTDVCNAMGHGFYNFSPELFYRTFTQENGFALERMVVYERYRYSQWYEVVDPQRVQSRVELVSNQEKIGTIVLAKKLADVKLFKTWPQQSDYVPRWVNEKVSGATEEHQNGSEIREENESYLKNALKTFVTTKIPILITNKERYLSKIRNNKKFSFKAQPEKFIPVDK